MYTENWEICPNTTFVITRDTRDSQYDDQNYDLYVKTSMF